MFALMVWLKGVGRTWASQGRLTGAGAICQVATSRDSGLCVCQEGREMGLGTSGAQCAHKCPKKTCNAHSRRN